MTEGKRKAALVELDHKLLSILADYKMAVKNKQLDECESLIGQIEQIKNQIYKLGKPA